MDRDLASAGVMDSFVRGVGSNRRQGDQDGVEVPRTINDVESKIISGYIYSLLEEGVGKIKRRPTRGLLSPILK